MTRQVVKNYNIHPHPSTLLNKIVKENSVTSASTTSSASIDSLAVGTSFTKVIFFMSIDYPEVPEYGKLTIEILQEYCKKHGYMFKLFNHRVATGKDKSISPYWNRVRDMSYLLDNYADYTIIYFDIDVVISPKFFNTPISNLMNNIDGYTKKQWDMYLATDPHYLNYEMNTGIVIIKNTVWSRNFVKLWFDNYPVDFWKKESQTGKWECSNCIWAGDEYEQGMLNRLYQRNIFNSKQHIIPVDYNIFGKHTIHDLKTDDCFIFHLMAKKDPERLSIINKLYPPKKKVTKTQLI